MSFASRPRLLCLTCQWRTFSTSYRRFAEEASKAAAATKNSNKTIATPDPKPKPGSTQTQTQTSSPAQKPSPLSPLEYAPRSYGKRLDSFTPTPLPRPIGMPDPPQPGENTGIDTRTLKQRHADFTNYDRHLERRKELYVSPVQ